jgi:hypothetical protein
MPLQTRFIAGLFSVDPLLWIYIAGLSRCRTTISAATSILERELFPYSATLIISFGRFFLSLLSAPPGSFPYSCRAFIFLPYIHSYQRGNETRR